MSTTKTYDDTNTGIIGKNDYKQKDTHPDQRGRCNVDGIWYWVSGWDKAANGRTFTSLAFTMMTQAEVDTMLEKRAAKQAPQQAAQQRQQPQQQQTQQQSAPQSQTPPPAQNNEPPMDFDDDIPF
ncbi:single strand DNA binding protein [Pantoea phage vB_PagM_SSEM1]|uniref:SsDNA binding protein n=1 Tax=Pantoea phage vB_PagM_SSEM1 TaxID=2721760 RepID=A0A6H0DBK4_9CAUD|nr:single strand DNA binding protein [Pantoea phage vB_PagM_SSEM1]QIS79332.1 ssDNA binding protein [Pantoea phage vB_PagM_SSEM1]